MQNEMPEVIYNIGCLKKVFTDVKLARMAIMQKDPLPPRETRCPFTTPAVGHADAVSVAMSLEFIQRFDDAEFIGVPCVPEELTKSDGEKACAVPFHEIYLARKYRVFTQEKAQSLIDQVFAAHEPVCP